MKKDKDRDLSERFKDYNKVYNKTGNSRKAIRAYCVGNKWLEENAKAVGNW